ncbi:hypothetical protein SADUNF_Sadunf01G0095300 [Salix dunnii]|uniref:Bifunctional inhibitor/plant lipid transfer protein/seed storage helical domain-containing protein n=1 Tax=Salix dunnii TaxID=1413687 RepID=A0A835NAT3_9ROSI|nr:hypothetical protein SADUNF_Sadunf01G0095300 [Salix dunnii]
MASPLKISMMAMMVVVFISSTATLTKAQDSSTSCASKLIPCQPYLSTTTQPPGSCCNSIKEAVAKELPCLCKIYNDPNLFKSLGLNVSQAVMLSQRCGVTTDLSNCNASAPSPTGSVPGKDGENDGSRMSSWTGFSGLLVLSVASLLY